MAVHKECTDRSHRTEQISRTDRLEPKWIHMVMMMVDDDGDSGNDDDGNYKCMAMEESKSSDETYDGCDHDNGKYDS